MQLVDWNASLGKFEGLVASVLDEAEASGVIGRIWSRDAALWKAEEKHQQIIKNSLGWLTVAGEMLAVAGELMAFAQEIRSAGFKHAMVCGMGGSSLCPEVLRQAFGPQEGFPELLVLDSTDPDVIAAFGRKIELSSCLFIIASKSGTTTEPIVFHKYWYDRVSQQTSNPGQSFVAITDPGSQLVEMARKDGFRRVFLNQSDIGGRYSALSYFGMVPAALMGLNVKRFLERADYVARSCSSEVPVEQNAALKLGAILGACANDGRDKLTLVTDQKLSALGLWIEQLIAESTGKEGKGIVPIANEPVGKPVSYAEDRLFVSISLGSQDDQCLAELNELVGAGHPVVYRALNDLYDLGGDFFVWELATAFAGWRLGINPFDQPNVQESKDATRELLADFARDGSLREQPQVVSEGSIRIYADQAACAILPADSLLAALRAHLERARSGDYIALLDYFEETPEIEVILQRIRTQLRDATKCATTTGYGPRFLHSTGQLHKGGPDEGVFLQLTADDKTDFPIPGETYSFSILKQAQALGDFHSLSSRRRRAIRIHFTDDVSEGLRRFLELIRSARPIPDRTFT